MQASDLNSVILPGLAAGISCSRLLSPSRDGSRGAHQAYDPAVVAPLPAFPQSRFDVIAPAELPSQAHHCLLPSGFGVRIERSALGFCGLGFADFCEGGLRRAEGWGRCEMIQMGFER